MPWPTTPTVIPDRHNSRALLVGTATHTGGLPDVPAASACVADLSDALTGSFGLIDPSCVSRLVDPTSAAHVLARLDALAKSRLDALLFSFVGHGLRDAAGRLCLALPGSVDHPDDARRSSLPVDAVFEILHRAAARRRTVILDCCYSGLALDTQPAGDVHLLTATDRVTKAKALPGARHTRFTGELLRLLGDGMPDGPRHLDLATVYRRLEVTLRADGLPVPCQRTINLSGDLALTRNPAYGTGATAAGLRSRAYLAQQLHRINRPAQAAEAFADIAADAARALPRTDPDAIRYRHAHASLTGEAGDPGRAVLLLDAFIADLAATIAPDHPALSAARASRDHWHRQVSRSLADTAQILRPPRG